MVAPDSSWSRDELAHAYELARPRLLRTAYAVTGSLADAEDVVADCWLKLAAAHEREPVRDVVGWCVVAVGRTALDLLRSAYRRRESYVGPWLPEPLVASVESPEDRVLLDSSVSWALLVVLEELRPAERVAWVLHDLFDVPFDQVAVVLDRSPAAVRQLASRGRRHLDAARATPPAPRAEHDAVTLAFLEACRTGDLAALVRVLDPDVVFTSDGGGLVSAARRPIHGPDKVGRFVLGIAAAIVGPVSRLVLVNGQLGVVIDGPDRVDSVVTVTVADGLVVRVDAVRSPLKLTRS